MKNLPIDEIIADLKAILSSNNSAVLVAPPGSGKTTRVPLELMTENWLGGRRILVLEPRRLAARAVARFMARSLGEEVGQTVGFRMKSDTRVSSVTKIEIITEGVLTRLLQADQGLAGVGMIIFDEFHERSIHADLGLALALESQAVLREDLRLLIMSATLEAEAASALMGDAPIIVGKGQSFPVETHYLESPLKGPVEDAVVCSAIAALAEHSGDMLIFLPGAGEIKRVEAKLALANLDKEIQIVPLHGSLPADIQDLAISPSVQGKRKIVLSTSIAETSITVEGIRIVVDSGQMRVPRFSRRTSLTRLETVTVSRAAADQRRGRAGRVAPGVCYRMWTQKEDSYHETRTAPEILIADLGALALELAAWGVNEASELRWLDEPPPSNLAQARMLLVQLDAISESGAITTHGRKMANIGLHPRLAHMIIKASQLGLGGLACEISALLSERDILRVRNSTPPVDLRLRLDALNKLGNGSIDVVTCRRIEKEANWLKRKLSLKNDADKCSVDACGLISAFAYPDRIAQLRSNGHFLLASGRGAYINESDSLASEQYIVAFDLDGQGTDSRIYQAASVKLEDLRQNLSKHIVEETTYTWDSSAQAVRVRTAERLGAITLKEIPCTNPDPNEVTAVLLQGLAQEGLAMLPWSRAARNLRQRLLFLAMWEEGWPDVTDEALLKTIDTWLAPYVYGFYSRSDLQRLNLVDILESMLDWNARQKLDEYVPTHIKVPSGQNIPIDYSNPAQPVLAVRLQEVFGLTESPRIAGRRVPLTLHLLSPAQRPVQVTQDLSSFWKTTYFEVRKDLMGRYPKHYWPDDPSRAVATNRVRPRPS